MKKNLLLSIIILCCANRFVSAQAPTLGSYPNSTIATSGSNAIVTPTAAPANAVKITAITSTSFRGILLVNLGTGAISITNAHPAGTYIITINAINGAGTAKDSFVLQVNNNLCSQGRFSGNFSLALANTPATVTIADLNNDGKQDIAVPIPASNSIAISYGDGASNFSAATSVAVGNAPQSIATGDFNNDGKPDFVSANQNSSTVSVRLGNSLGGFTNATNVPVGNGPGRITVADFNLDGNPDFATTNNFTNTVSIRLGNGAGGFTGTTEIVVGASPNSIVTGDFNSDGKPDFATANTGGSNVAVRLGDGLGGFPVSLPFDMIVPVNALVTGDFNSDGKQDLALCRDNRLVFLINFGNGTFNYQSGPFVGAESLAVGDFNGDGKTDIISTTPGSNFVYVWLENGTGNMNTALQTAFASGPRFTAVGDFNSDGRLDIVAANSGAATLTVGYGNVDDINVQGGGISIPDGNTTTSQANRTDFGNGNSTSNVFNIQNTGATPLTVINITLRGADSAFFTRSGITLPVTIAPNFSAIFYISFSTNTPGTRKTTVHVINDDCDEADYDFAIQASGVAPQIGMYSNTTVAMAGGNATITASSAPAFATGAIASAPNGFKGILQVSPVTGLLTITNAHPAGVYPVTVRAYNGSLSAASSFILTVNNAACGQGMYAPAVSLVPGSDPYGVAVADFNGDGKQDLAVPNVSGNNVSIRLGNGTGVFTSTTNVSVGGSPRAVAAGDFNGDGYQDFICANNWNNYVSVILGNGTGSFSAPGNIQVETEANDIITSDFNNDGIMDFATAHNLYVCIRLGTGKGHFTSTGLGFISISGNSNSLAVGDFNGDGNQDIIAGKYLSTSHLVLGNGAGGALSSTEVPNIPRGTGGVVAADFNHDGKQDVAFTNYDQGTVSVLLGTGLGTFNATPAMPVGTQPNYIVTSDFNGDGHPDIACMSHYYNASSTIITRFGDGAGGFYGSNETICGTVSEKIAVGDFNGDGRQDIAVPNRYPNALSIFMAAVNEINVRGNGTDIADGDLSVSTADNTDFSHINTGDSIVKTFIIQNIGAVPLTISNIVFAGADSSLFKTTGVTLPLVVATGDSSLFGLKFLAGSAGIKNTLVKILNNDCDESAYDFAIQASSSIPGAALHFDGVDDYISVNDTTGNIDIGPITISAWIKTTSLTASSILSKRNDCNQTSFLDFGLTAAGYLTVTFKDTGAFSHAITGTIAVNNGAWHHVAVFRKDSVINLYVDGMRDTMITAPGIAVVRNNAVLTIGASGCNGNAHFFSGAMDDLRVWGRALSNASILHSSNCELIPDQQGLLAYYTFNQGRSAQSNTIITTLTDFSNSGKTGTLHNFTLIGVTGNWTAPGAIPIATRCSNINTWLGTSPDWGTASNWSQGYVPFEETVVIINAGTPFMPEISDPESSCYSLKLNNGATVRVKSTGNLKILRSH